MANFIPSKKQASDFNNGVQYIDEADSVQAETINDLVESALYSQEQADSAKELVDSVVTNAFAPPLVGMHHIQFPGEPTPAQIWAGTTWSVDTDYEGITIIGGGINFPLGATGGATTHNHIGAGLYAKLGFSTASKLMHFTAVSTEQWAVQYDRNIDITSTTPPPSFGEGIAIAGTTANSNNMPPYRVAYFWKREA